MMVEDARRATFGPVIAKLIQEARIYCLELSYAQALSMLNGSCTMVKHREYRATETGSVVFRSTTKAISNY